VTKVALNQDDYDKLRWAIYVEQLGRCSKCGRPISFSQFQLHHATGRGIGGGFRNDLDPDNKGLCGKCHPDADRKRKSKF
jgi:hypothetical protein